MVFKTILPGAWEINQDLQYELFSLKVPTAWQQVVKSLAQKRCNLTGRGYPSVPVYSLDNILVASFPGIIQTARQGWQRPGAPWIFATETADLHDLLEFIKDWLREEFSGSLGEKEVELSLQQLDSEIWCWDDPKAYSSQWEPENKFNPDVRFQALPDYLVRQFLKNSVVNFDGEVQHVLTFYRVVKLRGGAELMSWPPYPVVNHKNKGDRGEAYISLVIQFKLQTVPWRSQPIIYHHLSVRRWIREPMRRLPYQGITAFVGDNRRWLDGMPQPFCFMPLQIKSMATENGREPRWPQAISNLLELNDSSLPEPQALVLEPAYQWSTFPREQVGMQIAIAYNTRHSQDPACLPGVSPLDLASLDRAIQEKIEQNSLSLQRVSEGSRLPGRSTPFWERGQSKQKGDSSPKERDDLSTVMLRPKIVGPATFRIPENCPQTILILWETQACRDALIAEICILLGLSPTGDVQSYQTPTGFSGEERLYEGSLGALHIKTQHVQDLTQALDLAHPSVTGKNRQQKRVNLLDERIYHIVSHLPKPGGLGGALIEIKDKKSFFPPESDPKLALRIGAAQAGYVNQHILALTDYNKKGEEYRKKDASNRVQRAVTDLLRQFGVLPSNLIRYDIDSIEPNVWLTCFYVLRRTRKTTANNTPTIVALMVRVNPISGFTQVTTPSLFPHWLSYSEGLKQLIREKWDPNSYEDTTASDSTEAVSFDDQKREQQFLSNFVMQCLRDCLNTPLESDLSPRVLWMAEAQNSRRMLPWMQNLYLPFNDLPDELKRNMSESETDRLWIVRLRTTKDEEVPVSIAQGSPGSRPSGIYQWQNICDNREAKLYLSMRALLQTEQGVLKAGQSRLDDGSKPAGNPNPLEIAVVHYPGIDPDQLARFVHNLRERWPYFADKVSLPFPFPLAIAAKEYAVSAKDNVDAGESEEVPD